ncbi:MAG: hypothetical protein IPP77_11045 [Bacteroidetes bacterium]|nr:hypothetical protein [Bacteroidota bacterium]
MNGKDGAEEEVTIDTTVQEKHHISHRQQTASEDNCQMSKHSKQRRSGLAPIV